MAGRLLSFNRKEFFSRFEDLKITLSLIFLGFIPKYFIYCFLVWIKLFLNNSIKVKTSFFHEIPLKVLRVIKSVLKISLMQLSIKNNQEIPKINKWGDAYLTLESS